MLYNKCLILILPLKITQKQAQSEGEPTLSKHLKSEIITVLSSLLIVHYQSKVLNSKICNVFKKSLLLTKPAFI